MPETCPRGPLPGHPARGACRLARAADRHDCAEALALSAPPGWSRCTPGSPAARPAVPLHGSTVPARTPALGDRSSRSGAVRADRPGGPDLYYIVIMAPGLRDPFAGTRVEERDARNPPLQEGDN